MRRIIAFIPSKAAAILTDTRYLRNVRLMYNSLRNSHLCAIPKTFARNIEINDLKHLAGVEVLWKEIRHAMPSSARLLRL